MGRQSTKNDNATPKRLGSVCLHLHASPGAQPASCTMGNGYLPRVKRPGYGVEHTLPSGAEVNERVELHLYSPFGPTWPVREWILPLPFPFNYMQSHSPTRMRDMKALTYLNFFPPKYLGSLSRHLSHCAMISYPCSASLGSTPTASNAFIRIRTTMSEWLRQGYWFIGQERQKWTWLKFRDAEQNTRHKLLRYLTFWKHLICISVLCSQMVRLPGKNWCHVWLPQSMNEFNVTHRISGCNEHKPNLYTLCLLYVLLPRNCCLLHSYPTSSSIKIMCV